MIVRAAPLLLLLLSAACSSPSATGGPGNEQPSSQSLFSPSVTKVVFEIDYQPGAEPYVGGLGAGGDGWQIMRDNVARLFQRSQKAVTLPTTLAQMEQLPAGQAGASYSTDAVLAIADAHRGTPSAGDTAAFYVAFLDGYFEDSGGVEKQVLGVSIGKTGVIAMFKPVIASTDGPLGGTARNVEQTTLVHELGHAVGLVDNGIPLTSAHHDAAHGAHCTNQRCTMYWENEGASSAAQFVKQILTGGSNVVFAADCLADVDAMTP